MQWLNKTDSIYWSSHHVGKRVGLIAPRPWIFHGVTLPHNNLALLWHFATTPRAAARWHNLHWRHQLLVQHNIRINVWSAWRNLTGRFCQCLSIVTWKQRSPYFNINSRWKRSVCFKLRPLRFRYRWQVRSQCHNFLLIRGTGIPPITDDPISPLWHVIAYSECRNQTTVHLFWKCSTLL
jgi:hypothetical protein